MRTKKNMKKNKSIIIINRIKQNKRKKYMNKKIT